jgi:hypothetical protein
MALTAGTDTFGTIAEADAYWSARGNVNWKSQGGTEKEQRMVLAADWLVRTFSWRGVKATSTQGMPWPRNQAYDDDGYEITGIPTVVKNAQFIIADLYRAGELDLEGIVTDDSAVQRQKVDVIEVVYDTQHRLKGPVVVTHVYQMLTSYIIGNELMRS